MRELSITSVSRNQKEEINHESTKVRKHEGLPCEVQGCLAGVSLQHSWL